jgi:hypothetical protein
LVIPLLIEYGVGDVNIVILDHDRKVGRGREIFSELLEIEIGKCILECLQPALIVRPPALAQSLKLPV